MRKTILILSLLLFVNIYFAQIKTPKLFRWQDQFAKKNVHKHIKYDTLIKTSEAIIHLNYETDSLKPYLLLLHGMGFNARSNWYKQIKPLSKHYNLILPDLIYFGESTSNSENYSVEFQAQQIHEAILKLGIHSEIHVMGFSYGGLTAAMFNQLFQNQVQKLIIIDGPVKFFSSQMADSLAKTFGVTSINNILIPSNIKEFNSMQTAVLSSKYPISKKMKQQIIHYLFDPTRAIRNKQINYLTEHQTTYQNYTYNLDLTPTLLIWGKQDGVVPPEVGILINRAYPTTTKLAIFPKAKHDAHFSQPKKLNKLVIDFISH